MGASSSRIVYSRRCAFASNGLVARVVQGDYSIRLNFSALFVSIGRGWKNVANYWPSSRH